MKPKVILEDEVFKKIMYWVNKSNYEVSGLGTVVYDKEKNLFVVKSAILLPQENTSSHTEIKPEAICKAMFQLKDAEGDLRFWWHSHVNMGVFWSGTDTDTIKEIGSSGWLLASVFNKKREVKSAYYSVQHLFPIMVDDLTTEIAAQPEVREAIWDAEYKENVENKTFTRTQYPATGNWVSKDTCGNKNGKVETTTGTIIKRSYTDKEIADALIVGKRPKGMPRKEWERLEQLQDEFAAKEFLQQTNEHYVHPYPFTQEEIAELAACGVSQKEIDDLLLSDWTREDILAHLQEDMPLINDDVPVADRRYV